MFESASKIALVISFILEIFFWSGWTEFYFRYGIPIFRKRLTFEKPPSYSHLADRLAARTRDRWLRNLLFEELSTGDVAFREEWVRRPFKFRIIYLPIMHGLIRLQPQEAQIIVTGMINWSVLTFLAAVAASIGNSLTDSTCGELAVVLLLVSGSYFMQYFHYQVVCEEIVTLLRAAA